MSDHIAVTPHSAVPYVRKGHVVEHCGMSLFALPSVSTGFIRLSVTCEQLSG
jgi:hypothetical protein